MSSQVQTVPPPPGQPRGVPAGLTSPEPAATGALAVRLPAGVVRGRIVRTGSGGALSRTPDRLRLAIAAALLASLVVSVAGLAIAYWQSSLFGTIEQRTTETVSLLDARSDVTTADATVTNAFLIGGLEPADLRAEYDDALGNGTREIALLAGSSTDGSGDLAGVSANLSTYSGLIEQARANNRQGLPVGAAYLDQGSSLLNDEALPALDGVVTGTANDAATAYNALSGSTVAAWAVLLAIGVLVWIQVWLSRLTRRTLNPSLLTGTIVAGLAVIAGIGVFTSTASSANDTRMTDYRGTLLVSQARSLAGQARSDEAFTLIRRGNGASFEQEYLATMDQAAADLDAARSATGSDSTLSDLLSAWQDAHEEIRALDDGGDWDGAVAAVTDRSEGSASAAYQAFVTAADEQVITTAASTLDSLRGASTGALVVGWAMALAGAVSAVLSWRGLTKRLEEYR